MDCRSALLLAALLLGCAGRSACAHLSPPPLDPSLPAEGPRTLVPDLAHDGVGRIAWLPGLGSRGAAELVAARPFLGVPLSLETLPLLPGMGAAKVRDMADFVQRLRASAVPQAPGDR